MSGIIGIYEKNNMGVAFLAHLGLMALQHRGQQSAGIAVCNKEEIRCLKNKGLVSDVFTQESLNELKGNMCLGHVKYGMEAADVIEYTEPFCLSDKFSCKAMAMSGSFVNGQKLKRDLLEQGSILTTNSDVELFACLIGKSKTDKILEAVSDAMKIIKGSYTITILTENEIIAVRDPLGIKPLTIGELKDGYAISSESCAFDIMGGKLIRDVLPGEIVLINENGLESYQTKKDEIKAICAFEYVYFARPDSYMDKLSINRARERAGEILYKEHPVDADVVIVIPDSGTPAALGFSKESKIPFANGLLKNRYVGRTFIEPTQSMREEGVKIKLNPMRDVVEGKRIVLVDDSIVRGTTTQNIIKALRNVGAKEIHVRISSPTVRASCYFGVDTSDEQNLIANILTVDEIRKKIGADSLGFISVEGLYKSLNSLGSGYCMGCFTKEYPMEV